MNGLSELLPLWRELEGEGVDYVLATVVAIDGSSYRKPGARMILSADGRRAGTVSGGCLEAEVSRKAWWLTEDGACMKRYSMDADDGDVPFGMGCGGSLWLLLERRKTASALFRLLSAAYEARIELRVVTVLDGPLAGRRDVLDLNEPIDRSVMREAEVQGEQVRVWCEYLPARPALWIFGAGNDVQPMVRMARQLGWWVAVADGRSHLATAERFPEANFVKSCAGHMLNELPMRPTDMVAIMTHSKIQDADALGAVIERPLAYLGVLGPQRRTREMLEDIDPTRAEEWLARVHTPMGLDLGGNTPASIALAALAEMQAAFYAASAKPLRQMRRMRDAVLQMPMEA